MVTASRLVSLDAVRSERADLIHLTGWLQVVAPTAMGEPPPEALFCSPALIQVDLRCDATPGTHTVGGRGVGLKTGARYWVEGVHQSRHHAGEFAAPFEVVARFELLGFAPGGSQPTQRTLTVRFRVTVPGDGRVTVTAGDVELLPPTEPQHVTKRVGRVHWRKWRE